MEGPTPSSAVYYGSLSIHAGCFLLLRAAPLLEHAPAARVLAGVLGAATAIFAALTTRVQSDVKSGLAYAALTQVGLIVLEISIGWYTLAFVHLCGHACFRLLQFLSAPNVLHDLHGMEDAMGDRVEPAWSGLQAVAPEGVRQPSVPDRARTRLPRQSPGPRDRDAIRADRPPADASGRLAVRRRHHGVTGNGRRGTGGARWVIPGSG